MHVARMVERRGAYRVLVGIPEGKKDIWKTRLRWEDNIKTDFNNKSVGCGLDLSGLR